jgi:glycosyltransferase A (GT-A) superfamily protein (DUF2064 family)
MLKTESPHSNTAILLFIREERQEALQKPLVQHTGSDQRVYQFLNQHVKKVARRTGYPLFIVDGHHQQGATFAERLANAFESVYQLGYESVLAVGNDCPTLSPSMIQGAVQSLSKSDMVIGPATDGGVYLIGVNAHKYNRREFLGLEWQSSRLHHSILEWASGRFELFVLPEVADDIDSLKDLRHFLQSGYRNTQLHRLLRNLLQQPLISPYYSCVLPRLKRYTPVNLRAPPLSPIH